VQNVQQVTFDRAVITAVVTSFMSSAERTARDVMNDVTAVRAAVTSVISSLTVAPWTCSCLAFSDTEVLIIIPVYILFIFSQ